MKEALKSLRIVAVLVTLTLFMGAGQVVAAEEVFEFKISIDTAPSHPRNQGLVIFMEELQKRSHGKLVPKFFHSGQLYKDAHVSKALRAGTVDMGVPGTWVLGGTEVNAEVAGLPMFFGQPRTIVEKNIVDGEWGKWVAKAVGKKLGTISPGGWYYLGEDTLFLTKKKVTKVEDVKGLKIRCSGGAAQQARVNAFEGSPVFIAWPDVPMALMQGTVDGIISTVNSVASSKLYEAGIKYGVLYRASYGYYVPLVSLKFWNRLTPDLQKIFKEVWEEVVPRQRDIANNDEMEYKKLCESKGMEFYRPSDEEVSKWREKFMPAQDQLIKDLKLDPAIVKMVEKGFGR